MSLNEQFLGKKCIFRTYSAGVHYGILVSRQGRECLVHSSIRIWKWDGACSLSQMANEGVKNPAGCKFAVVVPELLLTEVIEIIPCSDIAIEIIESVNTWKI